MYNDWEALDHVPIMSCFTSPFTHLDKVPLEHAEGWAHVWVDVMEHFEAAPDDAAVCRALKWLLVVHDLLLRLPPRGGRRGHDCVAQRFAAWQAGDKAKLVRWWEADRAATRHPLRHRPRGDDDADDVDPICVQSGVLVADLLGVLLAEREVQLLLHDDPDGALAGDPRQLHLQEE